MWRRSSRPNSAAHPSKLHVIFRGSGGGGMLFPLLLTSETRRSCGAASPPPPETPAGGSEVCGIGVSKLSDFSWRRRRVDPPPSPPESNPAPPPAPPFLRPSTSLGRSREAVVVGERDWVMPSAALCRLRAKLLLATAPPLPPLVCLFASLPRRFSDRGACGQEREAMCLCAVWHENGGGLSPRVPSNRSVTAGSCHPTAFPWSPSVRAMSPMTLLLEDNVVKCLTCLTKTKYGLK